MSGFWARAGILFCVACGVGIAGCSEGKVRSGATVTSTVTRASVETRPVATTSPRVMFTAATRPSAIVLAREKQQLHAIVADEDARVIAIVRLDAPDAAAVSVRTVVLDGAPARVAVGRFIYASLRDRSRVVAYALHEDGSAEKVAEASTASEPFGLALSPDGGTLLVTTAFGHTFEAFDAETLRPLFSTSIASEPRSILVSADGARAFISHAIGSQLTVVDLASSGSVVRQISLDVRERRLDFGVPGNSWALPGGPGSSSHGPPMAVTFLRRAVWGMELAAIDRELYLPETLVNPGDSFEPTGYGENVSSLSTHVAHVARVALADETLLTKHISGASDRQCYEGDRAPQCTLPVGVATLDDALYVACDGANVVLEHRLSEAYDEAPKCFEARKKQRRFPVGKGPRGIAIDPVTKHAFVWSALDRSLSEIDLTAAGTVAVRTRTIPLPSSATPVRGEVSMGRELFFASTDPRISNDGRACASCHPDGRQDGLLWPTPKGKRQTPMLAGRVKDSAPYDWNGANATLTVHIAKTTKNLHGLGLGVDERGALAAYLESLPGPQRESARADERVARGRAVFESSAAQCSSCHPSEGAYTDHMTHALGAGGEAFDTPSLRFVTGTAPYFHDGRYASLEELVEKCDGVMGQTKGLDAQQKADLVAFLRTL